MHLCCSDHATGDAQCGLTLTAVFVICIRSWNTHTPGVSFAQWGQPQAVRFSDCGEHFAAVGEGGVVATWRVDAPRYLTTDTGSLGRAEWCHQVAFLESRLLWLSGRTIQTLRKPAAKQCASFFWSAGAPHNVEGFTSPPARFTCNPFILGTSHGAFPWWLIMLQACNCCAN